MIDRARKAGDTRFQPRPAKPSVVAPSPSVVTPPAAIAAKPRPFGSLEPGECRFGLNSPERGRMSELLCCAAPVARQGAVYCAEHLRLAVSRVSASPPSSSASPSGPSRLRESV